MSSYSILLMIIKNQSRLTICLGITYNRKDEILKQKQALQFESLLNHMSLEATLIMLDNSAYAINGDYEPTRWEGQVDAASLLIQAKLEANQQSSVGVGLMGGKQVQILCTPTPDSTKASSFLFGIKCNGQLHFSQAIQIGALSLKHRSNDTQKQRMVCFVGSTISEDIQTLKILAKKLKKNAVAVDVICFGDCSEQQLNKLETFVNTIQNEDNSHLVVAKPGENISDKLIGSSIFGGGAAANIGGGMEEIDDPDLAAAIRMSLQESQQQLQPRVQVAQVVQQPQPVIPAPQVSREGQGEVSNAHQPTEQQLQQLAIQMSLQQFNLKQQNQKKAQGEQQQKKQKKQ